MLCLLQRMDLHCIQMQLFFQVLQDFFFTSMTIHVWKFIHSCEKSLFLSSVQQRVTAIPHDENGLLLDPALRGRGFERNFTCQAFVSGKAVLLKRTRFASRGA